MKGFLKFLLIVAVICGIGYVVYAFILPKPIQGVIVYHVVMMVDKDAKANINSVQNAKPSGYSCSYQELLEKQASHVRWSYIDGAGVAHDKVVYEADGITVAYSDAAEGDELYDNSELKVEFELMAGGTFNMYVYVNGEELDQNNKNAVIGYMADKVN